MDSKVLIVLIAAAAAVTFGGYVVVSDPEVTYSLSIEECNHGDVQSESTGLNQYSLTAIPDPHSLFKGWYVKGQLVSEEELYSLVLTEDTSIRAVFALEKMTVSVSKQYSESGDITVAGTYEYGTPVTLTQSTNEGFVFNGWYQNGELLSRGNPYSFVATRDYNILANFSVDPNVEVNMSMKNIGAPTSLSLSYTSPAIFSTHTSFTRNGEAFAHTWDTDQDISQEGTYVAKTTVYFVDGSTSVREFTFDVKPRYTITLSGNTGGDTWMMGIDGKRISSTGIEESGTIADFLKGDTVFFRADSEYGYDFAGWKLNGLKINNTNEHVGMTVSRNATVEAVYTPHKFSVTNSTTYEHGISSLEITTSGLYKEGGSVTVQLSPGYVLDGISINDGQLQNSDNVNFQILGDTNIHVKTHLSHDVTMTYSMSASKAPMNISLVISPTIADAEYTLKAYNTWDGTKTLYSGTYATGTPIAMNDYGLFSAVLTADYADGVKVEKSIKDVVVDGTKTCSYQWKFQTKDWLTSIFGSFNNHSESITYDLSFADYYKYCMKNVNGRSPVLSKWASFVISDDPYVKGLAKYITNLTSGNTSMERANCALKFVQSLSYTYDIDQFGQKNYFMYPLEMLWTKTGDCEDHAVLYAAIMKAMGYDVVLFYVETPVGAHAAVGLNHKDASGSFISYNGKNYFYCEATATSAGDTYIKQYEIGEIPNDYVVVSAIPIP